MRKEIFVLVLIFLLGIVSAHGDYWNMDGGDVLSYEKVENSNRFPVEAYRLGYTYRVTDDFKKRHEIVEEFVSMKHKEVKYLDWNKDYYYKWSLYSGHYKKIECYHSALRGKLFYRKCA